MDPNFENNVRDLLITFRELSLPVIHIQHLSTEDKSPLRPGQEGVEFIDGMEPKLGERVFQKTVNSAFIGTELDLYLRSQKIESLVVAGLTTDHCVSTTVRMAANFGFRLHVVVDCAATFERKRHGQIYPADLVHNVSLASLEGEFANLVYKDDIAKLVM